MYLIRDLGIIKISEKSKPRGYGIYKCDCGKEIRKRHSDFKKGLYLNCGCKRIKNVIETNTIHGLSKHRIFNVWNSMMSRCNNKKHKAYKYYGERGIIVCERWHNVANFIEDMYPSYIDGLSIDRIDNNGNYEPTNCRWTTNEVQQRNSRKIQNHNTSGYRGVSYHSTHKKWISHIGINKKLIHIGYFKTDIEAAKAYDQYVIDNNLEHTKNF